MKKEDARITRTKRQLRQGLTELLRNKPFERITVREICQASQINKMTFYKHYGDKYELLDDCAKATVNHVIEQVRLSYGMVERFEDFSEAFAHFVLTALDKVLEVKDVLLSLSSADGNFGWQVVYTALEQSAEETVTSLTNRLGIALNTRSVATFFVGGFASLAMQIVHEGSYDRVHYFRAAKGLCEAVLQAK